MPPGGSNGVHLSQIAILVEASIQLLSIELKILIVIFARREDIWPLCVVRSEPVIIVNQKTLQTKAKPML